MLHETIRSLTKGEMRMFKLMMERVSTSHGRNTLKLFDYLRQHTEEPGPAACCIFMYGSDTPVQRNRLYVLRHKLLEEINRSLVFQSEDLDQEQEALHQFLLARILLKRGHSRLARQVLDKARKDADTADLFHVKELIYRELLALAGDDLEVQVQAIVQLRKENDRKLEFVRSAQNAMSVIMQTLRKTNFSKGGSNVSEVMARLQAELQENKDIFQSPKGRIRLFNLTSNLLLQQEAFPQLEIYLREEFMLFENKGYFDRNTHRTKIVMLTWLVNATYKNFRFEASLQFCEQLREALEAFNRQFHDQFALVLQNGVINNLLGLGRTQEAVNLLTDLIENDKRMQDDRGIFLLINLAEALFELGKLRPALRVLPKVYLHPGYKSLDARNQLQVNVFELILRYENADWDFLLTRVAQVRHWHKPILANLAIQDEVIALLARNAELRQHGANDASLDWGIPSLPSPAQAAFLPGENEIIDYGLWMRSRKEGINYRGLMLETIKEAARP